MKAALAALKGGARGGADTIDDEEIGDGEDGENDDE